MDESTEQKTLLSVDLIVAAISALHSKTVLLLLLLVMDDTVDLDLITFYYYCGER